MDLPIILYFILTACFAFTACFTSSEKWANSVGTSNHVNIAPICLKLDDCTRLYRALVDLHCGHQTHQRQKKLQYLIEDRKVVGRVPQLGYCPPSPDSVAGFVHSQAPRWLNLAGLMVGTSIAGGKSFTNY